MRRHDWSFWRHDVVTQVAIWRQAGSFGQLVEPVQQFVSAQVAQDDAAALKIWAAPGQLPASVAVPVWPGAVPASIGREDPPPGLAVPQGTPSVGLQAPSEGGMLSDDDEHAAAASAKSVAIAALATAPNPGRPSARRALVRGAAQEPEEAAEAALLKDEFFEAVEAMEGMRVVFLGLRVGELSSVADGRCENLGAADAGGRGGRGGREEGARRKWVNRPMAAHTSRAIQALQLACP